MRSSPHPPRLPYPSPHEVPKQALSLLFNLSCPVWHARCTSWQCSDTWNCEDGYPSRACRRATSGESVTNARRPRPRVFLERTGRWPLPPAGDPRICSASGCRSPAAHAAPGTRPGREAWLLPRPADHAARRPGLPAPASAPGGAGRAWYPPTAPGGGEAGRPRHKRRFPCTARRRHHRPGTPRPRRQTAQETRAPAGHRARCRRHCHGPGPDAHAAGL